MPIQTALDSISQNQGSPFGFKNRIINGAMVIDQRNAGASVTPTAGAFMLDRWSNWVSQSSKFSVQQRAALDSGASNYEASSAPDGFSHSLKVTSSSAYTVGSGEQFEIRQFIEGTNVADLMWGTTTAKRITLSFWVKSSLTGTFGGAIRNSDNSRTYVYSYTINQANTWERKSITINGDTTGTWLKTTGRGITICFSMGAGSTYLNTAGSWYAGEYEGVTGQVNVVGTNAATWYLTGVQVEVGSQTTSFDYRPYGTELALCQRYYEKIGGDAAYDIAAAAYTNTDYLYFTVYYRVTKRATPTVTKVGTWTTMTAGQPTVIGSGTNSAGMQTVGTTNGRTMVFTADSTTYVTVSAEL